MTENQEIKILMMLKKNIQEKVSQRGISMAKLVREIDMSEPGFYKMLETGSMKVKTLVKIAEVLDEPLINLFEGAPGIVQSVTGNNNRTGVNSRFEERGENYGRTDYQDQLIAALQKQLSDKEKIIELLERAK